MLHAPTRNTKHRRPSARASSNMNNTRPIPPNPYTRLAKGPRANKTLVRPIQATKTKRRHTPHPYSATNTRASPHTKFFSNNLYNTHAPRKQTPNHDTGSHSKTFRRGGNRDTRRRRNTHGGDKHNQAIHKTSAFATTPLHRRKRNRARPSRDKHESSHSTIMH